MTSNYHTHVIRDVDQLAGNMLQDISTLIHSIHIRVSDIYQEQSVDELMSDIMYALKQGTGILVITKHHDKIIAVGELNYSPDNKLVSVSSLVVHEQYRNKGIGTELLSYIIHDVAPTLPDAKYITLGVESDNDIASHLYETLGFKTYRKSMIIENNKENKNG